MENISNQFKNQKLNKDINFLDLGDLRYGRQYHTNT